MPTHRNQWIALAGGFVYNAGSLALWSRTIGQRLVHIRVAMFDTFDRSSVMSAVVRTLVVALCGLLSVGGRAVDGPIGIALRVFSALALLAVFIPVFREERRGLHDRFSGTVVLLDASP